MDGHECAVWILQLFSADAVLHSLYDSWDLTTPTWFEQSCDLDVILLSLPRQTQGIRELQV